MNITAKIKPVLVKESNRERLQAALDQVQGRCSARTITVDQIFWACELIEKELAIPKKHMVGVKASVDLNGQTFPSAYTYIPESTWISLERTGSGWKLTDVERWKTAGVSNRCRVNLTQEAIDAIIESKSVF